MASNIKFKRSAVQNRVPTTAQLDLGELALNTYDGKLYTEINTGSAAVVEIGSKLSSLVVDGANGAGGGDVVFHGTTGSRDLTWDYSDNSLKLADNVVLKIGDNSGSGDMWLYHDTSNSYIRRYGSGNLRLTTSSGKIQFQKHGADTLAEFNVDGSIDLYYDNTKRFETTNTGVNITGITTTTQLEVGTLGQSLVGITTILDEDNFASNSATALATQQSIKAYVDGGASPSSSLAVSADSGSNESINLVTEVLDIEGTANEIETATGTNKVVIGLPNDVTIGNNLTVTSQLNLNGTVSAGSSTGVNGYYLKTTGIGVTWAAFPSTRTGLTTSATAGQTTFNFSYNVGFLDVFLNGVKLPGSEFTASNGSAIVLDDAAFANDTLEFVSYNTVPNSSAGAQNLTGLADVTITGTPVIGETLQHNGSQFVNDYTVSTTTTSTSQTAILNLPVATYRSVEYTIQMTEGTKYHVTKVLAIHNGTNVYFNEYGTLFTNSSLSAFALDVNSGNMRLLATPASTNSTAFKVKFTAIKV